VSTKKEKFIYAKLDVAILTHPKAAIAGPAAVGIYCLSVALCRSAETSGRLPREAALALLGGKGADSFAALTDPRVGWWVVDGDDIIVWNYAKKNDTAEEIAEARKAVAARVREHRARSSNARVTRYNRVTDIVSNADVPGSSSLSDLSERINDPDRDPEEQAPRQLETGRSPVAELAPPPAPAVAPHTPDDIEITADLVAWSQSVGAPRPTREHAQSFLTNARSKGKVFVDWVEGFKLWMLRERGFAAARASPPTELPHGTMSPPMKRPGPREPEVTTEQNKAYAAEAQRKVNAMLNGPPRAELVALKADVEAIAAELDAPPKPGAASIATGPPTASGAMGQPVACAAKPNGKHAPNIRSKQATP
jgi:hypothetical protein